MDALGINPGFLLIQIVNLIIAYVVISKWIVGPIMGLLEKRRQSIAQGLEDARVAAEARANAEKEASRIIMEAEKKANQTVAEARERAEVAARDVKSAVEAETAKARENALAGVEGERTRILGDLRGQVVALSIAAAQKLVGQALDEKRQHTLLGEFFSGVKSGKVVVLEDASFKGESAEVTSALPLTKEEEAIVKNDVLAKVGAQAVTFRIDPAILGGIIIKVGDKVLDGSVAGQLEGLRSNLK